MSGSTWTWVGNSTAWTVASNWSLTGGDAGNANNYPAPNDTLVLDSGAVQPLLITGTQTSDNTINLSGGAVVDFANGSTLDGASAVNSTNGTVDVSGDFTLLGSLGVMGSTATLTVDINGALISNGTASDIGINDGQAGSLNNGTLVITGGTVEAEGIHINDGIAIVSTALDSSDEISITGGSVEVDLTTPGAPALQFISSTVGSTIKFDDPTSYQNGSLQGFAASDTLDIGANIIGTIIYSGDLGGYADLTVENSSGSTLLAATISGGDESTFQAGTFTVGASGGTAGSFQVTQGTGDTLITEAGSSPPPPSGPVVTAGGSASYTAGGTPATLDSGLSLTDGESTTLASATVTISSGFLAGDTLVATASEPDISVGYSAGILTLTGMDTLADYQTVLDSVTYSSAAGDPTSGGTDDNRGITWAVNDGTTTASGSSSLSVSTPPAGPAVTAGGSAGYNAGGPPATLDAGLTISDAESTTLNSATVVISSGFLAGDTLAAMASEPDISVSYNAGTLTLTGTDTLADYQTVLDSVAYSSSAADPTAGGTDYSRTISWAVNDGTESSAASTSSLAVTASVGVVSEFGPAPSDFTGAGLSNILYEDTANGASGYVAYPAGSNQGSWTGFAANTAYSVAAIGDFTGGSTSEILYRDNANGAEGYYVPAAPGISASWVALPNTSTAYTVVGSGDFTGTGQDSILFEDSSGDMGYFTLGNSGPNTWQSLPSASLLYSVVGVGDFNGDGTSDIMFRDNANGQEGYYAMPRGGGGPTWVGLGPSSTAYSVVGIGNFSGSSPVAQIMYRDNANGDFGYVTPANGSNAATWTDIGLSSTAYTVVQVGDFMGNGLSDVLFRNNASGDVGYWAPPSGGSPATWTDLGPSSTAYSVIGSATWGAPIHFAA